MVRVVKLPDHNVKGNRNVIYLSQPVIKRSMDLRGKRILVIGGAGFIGSFVVEELVKTDLSEIVIFDNFFSGSLDNLDTVLNDNRVNLFQQKADILQIDQLDKAMDGIDYVIHLSALWLLHCYQYPRSAFNVNMEGTFNVIEAARNHKVRKLVYASSASVYGNSPVILTEESPFRNDTFYGATKIAGEEMLKSFYTRYKLPYIALRFFNVYGPRQGYKGTYVSVIMKILDRLDMNLPPIIHGDGSQSYDFIYVKDIARATITALTANICHGSYNICTGKKTSVLELCHLLLKLTGSAQQVVFQNAETTFVTNRLGSNDKARRELGFEGQVPLQDGLAELIEWRKIKVRGESL